MNRVDFKRLGDVVPTALDERTHTSWTVGALLRAATAIVSQLRCRHELLLSEREGREGGYGAFMVDLDGGLVEPLGDDVLRAESAEVLNLLANRLREYEAFGKRTNAKNWKSLRSTYGYDAREWTNRTSKGVSAHRVSLRVAICIAADVTFTPFARGLLDAVRVRQATLRIDVRSASLAIWSWASDYPALARSLQIARTSPDGEVMPFESFSNLYGRVLSYHLETGLDGEGRPEEVVEAAEMLGRIATGGIEHAGLPGQSSDSNIETPAIAALGVGHPDWILDDQEEDAEEAFARGATQIVAETLSGRRSPERAVGSLEALARGLQFGRQHRGSDA